MNQLVWVIRVMIRQERVKLRTEKKLPLLRLYTTNLTCTGLRLNPGVRIA
jgi:hypothetical protein